MSAICSQSTEKTRCLWLSIALMVGATVSFAQTDVLRPQPNRSKLTAQSQNRLRIRPQPNAEPQDASGSAALQFVPVTPCRVADTRNGNEPFGGPELSARSTREFDIPQSACSIPPTALAYSLNVTVVPPGPLGYLTIWPTGETQPYVSTLNSDGRVKANAAITPAGTNGGVSVYVSDATEVILDIDGYFVLAGTATLAFYPLTPCRIADTRNPTGPLGGPSITGGGSRAFPILSSNCSIPSNAKAYSLNVTAVPHKTLNYLTTWPTGETQPYVSTLNAPTGTVVANAAIVPAGSSGQISIFVSDAADVILDVNGYFALSGEDGALSLHPVTPCRVIDTRQLVPPFPGTLPVSIEGSSCAPPSTAAAYVLNATIVPTGSLPYLTLWPAIQPQPTVSTLNAYDGAITSNMAIVPTNDGALAAYSPGTGDLILDLSSYFAPDSTLSISTISPNSSDQESAGFTLSIVGSNFTTESEVDWNGIKVANPTLVSDALLTVQMLANATATPGPDSVTVVNPSPGGGTSNSAEFSVPCPIPSNTAASRQTHTRLGAYYFDGWSSPLTNFHFQGLPFGPFQRREPITGWQDNTKCSMERQLAWAHSFGIDFFVFDWYFNSEAVESGDNLNSALEITQALSDRHGVQFAILYVDSGPFTVQPQDWNTAVEQWIGYMRDPDYVLINGKPVLVVLDTDAMRTTFGSSTNVAAAFNQLRAAARSAGLQGVYILGALTTGYDHNRQSGAFPDLSAAVADEYDGFTLYNWSFGTVSGQQPFSVLAEAGQWVWSQAALKSPLPFIPVAMTGWDTRPWQESDVWFNRTPQDVTSFLDSAIKWTAANPGLLPESAPNPPIVLLEAWNEFGEGSHILPTVEDQTTYGDAIAQYLSAP